MIDKNWKLQRYDRKDYSALVEFPVEIVGRDGLTRRYTFEDAVRLYQRRITFAPIRYRDPDLVQAESQHCRGRIEQLRRSYFHAHGWGTPYGEQGSEDFFGPLSGELAAFLVRVLRCPARPDLSFQAVSEEADDVGTWYVTPRGSPGMLLYVHRFDGPTADRVRESFFSQLKDLEQVGKTDGDVERLLAFHHTVDCGFILAGRGDELDEVSPADHETSLDLTPTDFDRVLDLIRLGQKGRAMSRCRDLVLHQPWHIRAYRLGCLLALETGEPLVADELALIGTRYFPEDGRLLWYRAVALEEMGQTELADETLTQCLKCSPSLIGARAHFAAKLVAAGRVSEALECLRQVPEGTPEESRTHVEIERLLVVERRVSWLNRYSLLAAAFVFAVGFAWTPWLWAALPVFLLMAAAGSVYWSRVLRRFAQRPNVESVALGLRRLQRGTRPVPFDG